MPSNTGDLDVRELAPLEQALSSFMPQIVKAQIRAVSRFKYSTELSRQERRGPIQDRVIAATVPPRKKQVALELESVHSTFALRDLALIALNNLDRRRGQRDLALVSVLRLVQKDGPPRNRDLVRCQRIHLTQPHGRFQCEAEQAFQRTLTAQLERAFTAVGLQAMASSHRVSREYALRHHPASGDPAQHRCECLLARRGRPPHRFPCMQRNASEAAAAGL